jgi:hypothetical protein
VVPERPHEADTAILHREEDHEVARPLVRHRDDDDGVQGKLRLARREETPAILAERGRVGAERQDRPAGDDVQEQIELAALLEVYDLLPPGVDLAL